MKKLLAVLIGVAVLATLITMHASAQEITVLYKGEKLTFDVSPKIENDRVMVPMRTVFEAFGAKVKWDGESGTVTAKKKSDTVEMTVNSTEMKKNDEEITSDVAPVIENGRTLIPLRAVSELLDLEVSWDDETKTVSITKDDEQDDLWKENTGSIDLTKFTVTGTGNTAENGVITITEAGDYTVTGNCSDGQIIIDSEGKVKLRLSGMSLTNKDGAAIYIKNADKAFITLTEDTENYLSDGEVYANEDEKACITAKDNLEIKGKGNLEINANYNHGIKASDSLEIENGNITITSKNDAINVNDTFELSGGTLNLTAYGDGIQAEEIVDISGGTVNITTKGDVPAATNNKKFGAAQNAETDSDVSSKGIKADWILEISGGIINITSTDHAIHCASDIVIDGAELTINSDNKGISAHGNLTINGGKFNIPKASEGIESKQIMTINGGDFYIIASDDGLNAGGGSGFGGMPQMPNDENMPDIQNMEKGMKGQRGQRTDMDGNNGKRPDMPPQMDGNMGTRPDMMPDMEQRGENMPQDMRGFGIFGGSDEISTEHHIQINGGNFYILAVNDGIDANGSITITGGTIVVEGRSVAAGGELGLDADGRITISGGEVLAAGSTITARGAEQNTAVINLSQSVKVGAHFEIRDEKGNTISEIASVKKEFSQILCSSEKLKSGKEYKVYADDTLLVSFTQEEGITQVGTAQNSGFGKMGQMM